MAVVMCSHPMCGEAATDERGGFLLCRAHFFLAWQWELPALVEEGAA